MKYKINKEFFPFSILRPPIAKPILKIAQAVIKPPHFFFNDKEVKIDKIQFSTFDNELISSYIISPNTLKYNPPCIIFLHGGGFVYEPVNHHYALALEYAKRTNSKLFLINYRLSPKIKLPDIVMDVYYAFKYIYNNSNILGFNINKICIIGDSAGGYLTHNLTSLLKNENINIKCQLLIYPFLDNSLSSKSTRKYTDTPMWNSKLSNKITKLILPNNIKYTFPIYKKDLTNFPPTYIEIAEYDSLKDDGRLYHKLLNKYNVYNEIYEIKGAMHAFDIKWNAETSKEAINMRISFMNKHINKD